MDFVFVGLRLKNGDAAGKLPPISIRVGETAACVPLRLTSIAATANMPILVWVLGEARAVPKNFMHVVLNPQAVSWPGAPQYQDVLNEAVDSAVGHGFITESAQPASDFAGLFLSKQQQAGAIDWPEDAIKVLSKYESLGLPFDATFTSIATEVTGWDGLDGIDGLRAHLSGVADSQPWIDAIEARILEPLGRIQAMFDRANVVTRLYTTVDPEDMTRDPIFVFNPDLPLVSRINVVKGNWDGPCTLESVDTQKRSGTASRLDGARWRVQLRCPCYAIAERQRRSDVSDDDERSPPAPPCHRRPIARGAL